MRNQKQRCSRAGAQRENQIDNGRSRRAIKIAGGFIGKKNFRLMDDGARQRHALLFAARKLPRIVMSAGAKTNLFERCPCRRKGVASSDQFQRHRNIFQSRHSRDEVERLKHDAHMFAAKARQRIFTKAGETSPSNGDGAGGPRRATASPLGTVTETPFRMLTGPAALANVSRTSSMRIDGVVS